MCIALFIYHVVFFPQESYRSRIYEQHPLGRNTLISSCTSCLSRLCLAVERGWPEMAPDRLTATVTLYITFTGREIEIIARITGKPESP